MKTMSDMQFDLRLSPLLWPRWQRRKMGSINAPIFRLCQRGHDRCDKCKLTCVSYMVFMCYTTRRISHRSCSLRGHLHSTGQFRKITCTLLSTMFTSKARCAHPPCNTWHTCQTHITPMSYTCTSHVKHMPYTCRTHVKHVSNTCPPHVMHMSNT